MIAALLNRPQYLRIAFVMLLVFFSGSKIVSPVYKVVKAVYNEFSETASSEDNGAERVAEKDLSSAPSFFQDHNHDRLLYFGLSFINDEHGKAYEFNYSREHYREITSPPPDRS